MLVLQFLLIKFDHCFILQEEILCPEQYKTNQRDIELQLLFWIIYTEKNRQRYVFITSFLVFVCIWDKSSKRTSHQKHFPTFISQSLIQKPRPWAFDKFWIIHTHKIEMTHDLQSTCAQDCTCPTWVFQNLGNNDAFLWSVHEHWIKTNTNNELVDYTFTNVGNYKVD